MADPSAALEDLESIIGVSFQSRELLSRALTHRSWLNEHDEPGATDNERLEFLGDALIDFVVGEHLFRLLPDAREGDLTLMRARLVNEQTLARLGKRLDLGSRLRVGHGEEQSGGRFRQAILCDAFEALVGAIYLDQGINVTTDFILHCLESEIEAVIAHRSDKDPKSMFQEEVQARWQLTPRYETVRAIGPDHAKEFTVRVLVDGRAWTTGHGRSKADAARDAASRALVALTDGSAEALMDQVAPRQAGPAPDAEAYS